MKKIVAVQKDFWPGRQHFQWMKKPVNEKMANTKIKGGQISAYFSSVKTSFSSVRNTSFFFGENHIFFSRIKNQIFSTCAESYLKNYLDKIILFLYYCIKHLVQ